MNLSHITSYVLLLAVIYFVVFSSLPFSFYVSKVSLEAGDVCVGEDTQMFHNERTPRWGIRGETFSQVIKFAGQERTETTIDRHASFGYEPDTDSATYQVKWSEPFEKAGTYGVNEWVTIYPLPFIEVQNFTDAADLQFNVIPCEEPKQE